MDKVIVKASNDIKKRHPNARYCILPIFIQNKVWNFNYKQTQAQAHISLIHDIPITFLQTKIRIKGTVLSLPKPIRIETSLLLRAKVICPLGISVSFILVIFHPSKSIHLIPSLEKLFPSPSTLVILLFVLKTRNFR